MTEQTGATPPLDFRRAEDFASVYSNNLQFEQSAWDFKIIFGELDQRGGKSIVTQHASVTLPWIQVKLLSYYLHINLAVYEMENGKIKIPNAVLPPTPLPPTPDLATNPQFKRAVESINKIRDEFIAGL